MVTNIYIYRERERARERERERFPIFVRPFEAWSSQTRWWSNSYPVDFPLLTHPSFELERLRQGRECCWPPNRQVECSCHWCRTCRLVKKRLFVDWVDWFWWFMFRFLVKGQTIYTIMYVHPTPSSSLVRYRMRSSKKCWDVGNPYKPILYKHTNELKMHHLFPPEH